MRIIRKFLLVFATILLVVPSLFVTAETDDNKSPQENGEVSSKDEVVYAKLSATGERQEMYVVNILNVEKAGKISDYGSYSNLKNLTDLSPIELKGNKVEVEAPKGKFYYQGNMNEKALPWDVSVSYLLDGKEIKPKELAGKDGHIQIKIKTSANENVDRVFFNNYLLQISLSLNLENFSTIQASNGMLANAGKNKQVTFTVMPEKEEELIVKADVVDFELDGINIAAIPSSLPIDAPNIDDMTGDMEILTNAIKKVNNGVFELKNGVTDLNNGVKDLRNGSREYKDGISTIDDSSSDLVGASKSIHQALTMLSNSLSNGSDEMNLGDLKKLEGGLMQIADGLKETSKGLADLNKNYASAYSVLDQVIAAIPDDKISDADIQQLYESGANKEVLDQLLETYSAAQSAKGTYTEVKAAFAAVEPTLAGVNLSLTQMADNLTAMANGLSASLSNVDGANSLMQLQEGLSKLSSNYQVFHKGLVDYTGGISQLSSYYEKMHNGIEDLSEGTTELENGVSQLYNGTNELYESTNDLPEQMKQEVDQMIADYDKSDFKAVSFVSPQNEKINSVQFVIKTESIKQEEAKEAKKVTEEVKGFWSRLIDLFK